MSSFSQQSSSFTDDLELAETALEGDQDAVLAVKNMVDSPKLVARLCKYGASQSEAAEIIGDMLGDCFGGKRARGGLHQLLGRYNGSGPLGGFLSRAAMNRLISQKRKEKNTVSIDQSDSREDGEGVILVAESQIEGEDAIVELLCAAVKGAFSKVDQEGLVLFRMVQSYGIPQKKVGQMWGWHESKISRAMSKLMEELKGEIIQEVARRDPWLHLEWEDFLQLCGGSVDLFDY